MHTSAVIASGLTLLGAASARITGFAMPDTVKPGSTVKFEIEGSNYIQSVQDVAMSFGYSARANAYPGSLGILLDSKFLGPDDSNVIGNITHYITIPSSAKKGPATFSAGLFSLYGAVYSPTVENFAVNVTIGSTTSSNYVTSSYVTTP